MLKEKFTAVLVAGISTFGSAVSVQTNAESNSMRDISTMELVHDMGIGINLGNTMESCGDWIAEVDRQWGDGILHTEDYEKAWGSPIITKPMIDGMANEGFGVVRVPVAWSNMMEDDGTYTINADYTARVKQIVDWVLDADMYCIINIHWDNGWVNKFPENPETYMNRYETMWTQIADSFKDYGDHLIFESQNEELGWDSIWNQWSGTQEQKEKSYALVNQVNQKFVDVIRHSGGNNPQRHLLISGYNTDINLTCDSLFKMPDDPANRMAISVHYYTPAGFAILEEDASWAKARSTWGTDDDYKELNQQMDMMKTHYADKGIPVIIGEYGCPTVGKEPESVRKFLSSVCAEAYSRGFSPVLWATPQSNEHPDDPLNGHYNRTTCKMADQELKNIFNEITGFTEKIPDETPENLMGDVNLDGSFNIADVVTFQKWLLNDSSADLRSWENADYCKDEILDVYDFCMMRNALTD